jgi:cysteine synthase A
LKVHDQSIFIAGVEPASSPTLAGPREAYPIIEGITDGIIPDVFDSGLVDEVFTVTDETAIKMAHRLAVEEGIFCGMSSGANVLICIRLAEQLGSGKPLVTVLPESRDRYLEVEQYTTWNMGRRRLAKRDTK